MTALDRARIAVWRAAECDSSMLRSNYLFRARDELLAAGFVTWADLVESAAGRIGGSGCDMRQLYFDIEVEISRLAHALPEAAQ